MSTTTRPSIMRVEEAPVPGLRDGERLLGPLASRDVPGQVGERGDVRDVRVVVVGGLVAHAQHGADAAGAQHRDGQLPDDRGVPGGQSLHARSRGVVVVDDRLARPDAVGPDPGLVDRVVRPCPLRGAHLRDRVGRPGLQREGGLVVLDEVEEADLAAGELLGQVERGDEKVLQRRAVRALEKAQASAVDTLAVRPRIDLASGRAHIASLRPPPRRLVAMLSRVGSTGSPK